MRKGWVFWAVVIVAAYFAWTKLGVGAKLKAL